jgi:hypothetical protein
MVKRFLLKLLAPTVVQINDVVLTRGGYAYWVQPGRLIQMRVIPLHRQKIKETE